MVITVSSIHSNFDNDSLNKTLQIEADNEIAYHNSEISETALSDNSSKSHKNRLYRSKLSFIGKIAKKLHLRILLPFILIILYTLVGAALFLFIERANDVEIHSKHRQIWETSRENLIKNLVEFVNKSWEEPETINRTFEAVSAEFGALLVPYEERNRINFQKSTVWNYWNALFYAGTVYTTIGYGNIACVTVAGRWVTIIYAIIGIPLMLSTLNFLGKNFLQIITHILRLVGRCMKKIAPGSNYSYQSSPAFKEIIDPKYESTKQQLEKPDDLEVEPPFLIALLTTFSWVFLCSGVFLIWESQWDYFTSLYFFFTSLITIGFGDVLPSEPRYMVLNFFMVIVGLSLVTMCVNVLQGKLAYGYMRWLQKMLGQYNQMLQKIDDEEKPATATLINAWKESPEAKLIVPFLSKNAAVAVMHEFQEKAESQGVQLPQAFKQLDPSTGMPAIFTAEDDQLVETLMQEPIPQKPEVVFVPEARPEVMDESVQTEISETREIGVPNEQEEEEVRMISHSGTLKVPVTDEESQESWNSENE